MKQYSKPETAIIVAERLMVSTLSTEERDDIILNSAGTGDNTGEHDSHSDWKHSRKLWDDDDEDAEDY